MTLENTAWRLVSFASASAMTPIEPDTEITLTFATHEGSLRIAGSGGCNRYFAPYEIDGESCTVGPIGSTKMMGSEPAMRQETRYFATLSAARRFTAQDDSLVIYTSGDELRFARMPN